jgi:predicted membrane protein
MTRQTRLFLFTILAFSLAIVLIVYRYEYLLKEYRKPQTPDLGRVAGGKPTSKQYMAAEIIEMIRKSKEYIGDSITIFDNGDITSSNEKLQGTIAAVLNSKDNMNIVYSNANTNKLPLQYNVYVLAATYYRQQYADEFK